MIKEVVLACNYCKLIFRCPTEIAPSRIRRDKYTYETVIVCPMCEENEGKGKIATGSEPIPW